MMGGNGRRRLLGKHEPEPEGEPGMDKMMKPLMDKMGKMMKDMDFSKELEDYEADVRKALPDCKKEHLGPMTDMVKEGIKDDLAFMSGMGMDDSGMGKMDAAAVGAVQLTMEGSVADYDDAKILSIKRDIAKETGILDINKIRITVKAGSVVLTVILPPAAAKTLVSKIENKEVATLGGSTVSKAVSVDPPVMPEPEAETEAEPEAETEAETEAEPAPDSDAATPPPPAETQPPTVGPTRKPVEAPVADTAKGGLTPTATRTAPPITTTTTTSTAASTTSSLLAVLLGAVALLC